MNSFIRERENGKFQAIISYKNGDKWKQKSKGGFNTKKEAKEWIKKATFEVLDLERKNIIDSDITLKELKEIFIDNQKLKNRRVGTIHSYNISFKIFESLDDVPIQKILPYDAKKMFLEKIKKTGNNYQCAFKHFKTLFNFAIKELNIIAFNPLDGLTLSKKENKRIMFIDEKMYSDILKSVMTEKQKLFIEVLYSTGLRLGEALGITLFDLSDNSININKQWLYVDKVFGKLKTNKSNRVVPISSDLYLRLKKIDVDIAGRIFYDIHPAAIRHYLTKFNTSPHCFRHTYTTHLLSEGIDPTIVSSIVGDNIETILKVYAEINKDKERESFEKIRAIF
ncbi:MAG: tyrosine-type recombinase/integrase [Peptoniphilus sp.]|uniref:tyrosine-type recombinase/integrase n=1 Tax=Peptoniphilus sp. TaxID=1971214 RepID=UPI002A750FF2|nr:tyrosine-type recombinase/integrase [Peptoniphilus sp.]MDY2986101.1 tyrosine-type recombinase/integrase [Peptoniphilus sp.]